MDDDQPEQEHRAHPVNSKKSHLRKSHPLYWNSTRLNVVEQKSGEGHPGQPVGQDPDNDRLATRHQPGAGREIESAATPRPPDPVRCSPTASTSIPPPGRREAV